MDSATPRFTFDPRRALVEIRRARAGQVQDSELPFSERDTGESAGALPETATTALMQATERLQVAVEQIEKLQNIVTLQACKAGELVSRVERLEIEKASLDNQLRQQQQQQQLTMNQDSVRQGPVQNRNQLRRQLSQVNVQQIRERSLIGDIDISTINLSPQRQHHSPQIGISEPLPRAMYGQENQRQTSMMNYGEEIYDTSIMGRQTQGRSMTRGPLRAADIRETGQKSSLPIKKKKAKAPQKKTETSGPAIATISLLGFHR